jgi:hypothetical protein
MGGKLSEDELRRLKEFSSTPRHERRPKMLLPDDGDEPDDQ